MTWRDVLLDIVRYEEDQSIVERILKRVKCASYSGTGLDALWQSSVECADWDGMAMVIDACTNNLPNYIVNFLASATVSHPMKAYNLMLSNLYILNAIPGAGSRLSTFLRCQSTTPENKYSLFLTLCLGLPSHQLVLAPDLFETLFQFAIDVFNASQVEETTCVYCLHNLLDCAQGVYLSYHDSYLFQVFDLLAKLKDPGSSRLAASILSSVLDVRRSSVVGLETTLVHYVYKLLLSVPYTFPESCIKRVEELDFCYDHLPIDALLTRVKERKPGYVNALTVLSAASSHHIYWAFEITSALHPCDILHLPMDNVLSTFVSTVGYLVPELIQECSRRYLESNDKTAIQMLQHISYRHVDNVDVFERCVETLDYDGVVMLVGKTVRLFDSGNTTAVLITASSARRRQTYRDLIVRLTKNACLRQDIDALQVVIRGLRMITNDHDIHQLCLGLMKELLCAHPNVGQELGNCLRYYATGCPRAFLDIIVQPLAKEHNAEALCWLFPRFTTRSVVGAEIENQIVTELQLHFRQSQHPGLLYKVIEYTSMNGYEFGVSTKASLFKLVLDALLPRVRQLVLRRSYCVPLHVTVMLRVLARLSPPIKYLSSETIEQINHEALAINAWLPRTATTLLWTIRERSSLWAYPFLCSVLDRDDMVPSSFGNTETAVETYIWTCYRQGEDPIPNTFGSQYQRTRDASKDVLTQLPAQVVAYVKKQMYTHIVKNTIPHRYVRKVYSSMCKAVPQQLFCTLQQHVLTVPDNRKRDVLRLMYDLLVNVSRPLTNEYAESLAWWVACALRREGADPENQLVLIDILVYCIDYLFKTDCKRGATEVVSFQSACKRVKPIHNTRSVQVHCGNRLDTLLPEIKKHITQFIHVSE